MLDLASSRLKGRGKQHLRSSVFVYATWAGVGPERSFVLQREMKELIVAIRIFAWFLHRNLFLFVKTQKVFVTFLF